MKAIIEFIQSIGTAEIIIGIALIAICVIAWFDGRSIDKKLDRELKWFKKRYGGRK